MAQRRSGREKKRGTGGKSPRRRTQLRVQAIAGDGPHALRIVHPRCARQRAEDLEEVRKMLEAGEVEIAKDELRWLLNDCSDCVEIHQLLGDLAYADGDRRLARGHYGYAYDIVLAALPRHPPLGALPYQAAENRSFFHAAVGLARCLLDLDKAAKADKVLRTVLGLDPSDPLGCATMSDQWHSGGGDADGRLHGENGANC